MRLGRHEAVPLLEKLWDKLVDNMLEGHRKPGFISSVKDEMKTGKKKKGELAHTEVLIASSAWAAIVSVSVKPAVLGKGADISIMNGEKI